MAPDGSALPTLPVVEFELILPTTEQALMDNVRHSLALGLPEADNRLSHVNLVANGPSVRGRTFDGPTMALNGAINLPAFRKVPADMWCVSDPQALVADFIKRPSKKTAYLVASKCHPAVFERLKGYDVRLWHLSDVEFTKGRVVPCATSVTLTALLLLQRLGARSIDVYGWDCCFAADGTHHAADGEMGLTASVVDVRVGPPLARRRRARRLARLHRERLSARAERLANRQAKRPMGLRHDRRADANGRRGEEFKSTPTWAVEAQEAVNILPLLRWAGVDVVIHGDGMVRAIAAEYADVPLPGLKT